MTTQTPPAPQALIPPAPGAEPAELFDNFLRQAPRAPCLYDTWQEEGLIGAQWETPKGQVLQLELAPKDSPIAEWDAWNRQEIKTPAPEPTQQLDLTNPATWTKILKRLETMT